jgi:cell wall-associated NlpC family hydrolase
MALRATWVLIAGLALGGCASTGAVPSPFPRPGSASPSPSTDPSVTPSSTDGYAVAGTALALQGAPYRNGGSDLSGFDCSGLVQYVFSQHGVALPRSVDELVRVGTSVNHDDIQSGDLLFFAVRSVGASHVGIAIGGDEFVHAPKAGAHVRTERFSSDYWAPRFVGARRLM